MQSEVQQRNPGIKRDIRGFLWLLVLPVTIGLLAPFVETSRLFAEDGWWRSLSSEQQLAFVLGWAINWVILLTGSALATSLVSRRWRGAFWKPLIRVVIASFRVLRAIISLIGFVLVSQKDLERRINAEIQSREENAAAAGPPRGTGSGVPGVTYYGDVFTRLNIYDSTLTVAWRTNNLSFGQLIPAPGNIWRVQYGHVEGIHQSYFIEDEDLGRVTEIWEGVDRLRKRDLRERNGR